MIYFILIMIAIYVYAFVCKDHRVYRNLLFCAIVSFVIGACVKSKTTIFGSDDARTEVITSNPTVFDDDSAVVWTDSIMQEKLGQEEKSDMIISVPKSINSESATINNNETMRRNGIYIQNDS